MYKKLLLLSSLFFITTALFAQTIVSTSPENRNIILEEFTGIYCGFCPDGHSVANGIQSANPDDFFIINVHQGGFAIPTGSDPNFITPWADAIANQTGLLGYPAGTINRTNFPGLEMGAAGTTALGRFEWTAATNLVLAESSYVNLAVEATIDIPTNSMTIHVEAYYTGDSPESTNMLNVAILQNNTLGPQSGGNQGNNYNHQHRLIDLATGQWGEEITETTTGSFIDRTYNYTFPASINGVYIDHNEIELVVFMAENNQTIVSGNKGIPDVNPLTSTNDASLLEINKIYSACGITSVVPEVTVLNSGTDPITSLNFTYSTNGGATETHAWSGNLESLETVLVELPTIDFIAQPLNTVDVSIENDDFNDNNTTSTDFDDIIDAGTTVDLTIVTDQYAQEISWELLASDGTVLESAQLTASDNNMTLEYNFTFSEDCITFNINDSYGDGIINGGASLIDTNNIEIYPFFGNYGGGDTRPYYSNEVLGTDDLNLSKVAIYPNPATSFLIIENAENSNIEIYDLLGKLLVSKSSINIQEQLNVSNFVDGTYFIKIYNGTQLTTEKFIISR